jgi:thiamine biosynthesis lipoprotein
MLAFIVVLAFACTPKKAKYIFNEGFVYGTIYHITYESPDGSDLHDKIKSELNRFDFSLSTFNPESVVSKINNNTSVQTDSLFRKVFLRSIEIWESSQRAFDPTVAPLVNAWGFGFKHAENITQNLIDSLLQFTGMEKIKLQADTICKSDQRVMLDFSAIAKGYAVDVIGTLLENLGCKSYMVEIGGEVVTKGINPRGAVWQIGINQPNDDEPLTPNQFQAIIAISGKGLATSGNYRNFYEKDGKKYAHTINPASGFPVDHNLLSATVIANDCMTADAYATAFMVLGTEKAMELASNLHDIEVFLIYDDENGERKVMQTAGFSDFIVE